MEANPAMAQGTAFTYQGELNDGGSPAHGNYDFQFLVYDSTTNGNLIAGPVTNLATPVTNGLFTTTMDFGAGVFSGSARWLQIAVRTNGSNGGFTILAARQAITPTPYAITASNLSGTLPALQLTGALPDAQLGGVYTAPLTLDNLANRFVGDGNAVSNLSAANLTGTVAITNGGTGQSSADAGLAALGGASLTGNNWLSGSNTFGGVVTANNPLNVLAGNAQGGAIINLDHSIANVADYGNDLAGVFADTTYNGGTIYMPTFVFAPQTTPLSFSEQSEMNAFDAAVHLIGNGPNLSTLAWSGTNGTLFDSTYAPFGFPGIDLSGFRITPTVSAGGDNNGYISAPGGGGTLDWRNVEFDNWDIGACLSFSGMELSDLSLNDNNVGLILPYISDGNIVHIIRAFGNTNAALEVDSRGNQIYGNFALNNIDILIGSEGDGFIQTLSEGASNCVIALGYPSDWPFSRIGVGYYQQYAGFQRGNTPQIHHVYAGFGYTYAGPPGSAYMKIWSVPYSVHLDTLSLSNEPAIVIFTNAANTVPMTFDNVATGGSNLVIFSDGTSVPSQDNQHVGVNIADYEYTKNVLKYSRDTNGDVSLAGGLSTAEGNGNGPVLIPLGHSPFTYVNTTGFDIEVYVDAGAVSSIEKNGTKIFSSTGKTFHLQPDETFTLTYSSAPNITYSPF
jgi:hypothetical protein